MGKTYKISGGVEKIICPLICEIDGTETEYPNGKALYAECFDRDYGVAALDVRDGKIVVRLAENKLAHASATNWLGEEMYAMPAANEDEEWVKQHKEQFGSDPGFF